MHLYINALYICIYIFSVFIVQYRQLSNNYALFFCFGNLFEYECPIIEKVCRIKVYHTVLAEKSIL